MVHDMRGTGFSFSYGGFVWSAPQTGSTDSWDYSGFSQVIADHWASIALLNQATISWANQATYGTGFDGQSAPPGTGDVLFSLLQSAVSSAGGGSIGTPFTPSQDAVFSGWGVLPNTTVASGGSPGEVGGSYPPGWVPSGDSDNP